MTEVTALFRAGLPQVVILAGGLGTRLRSVAGDTPKILVPVCGRPFVEWQFDLLKRHGARDVLLCVGHGFDQVEAHVGDGERFGLRVRYSHEDPRDLLGTGGALVHALPELAERFLVLYGDSYLPIDYGEFAKGFAGCGQPVMMSVYRNLGRWDRSNVRVEHGRVVFYDKNALPGTADCIDYGLIGITRSMIANRRNDALPLDLATILGDAVRRGEVAAWLAPERFYEIGSPSGLTELEAHLKKPHMKPALFLDRDGILNEMVYDDTHGLLDSPRRPEQVRVVPGAAALMTAARARGYAIVVVTNQPGIAKGTLTETGLAAVNGRLADLLREQGAAWDAIYHCPHHPRRSGETNAFVRDCDCRKPKPGMLIKAASDRKLDLARSWMVGDGVVDIQAGRAAGCRTILVANLKLDLVAQLMQTAGGLPDAHCPAVGAVFDIVANE